MEVTVNKQARLSEHLTSSSVATLGQTSELDGSRLSPHFTLAELCKTKVNLENVPNEAQVENLKRLCGWLEELRRRYNKRYNPLPTSPGGGDEEPIIINSGYRSEAVNKAIGGVKGSNHLTGCAADIRVAGIEQLVRYATILLDISDESCEDHFAVRPSENRRKVRLIQT